jgi:hypothetical protein
VFEFFRDRHFLANSLTCATNSGDEIVRGLNVATSIPFQSLNSSVPSWATKKAGC